MGLNAWLAGVDSYGCKTATAGTAISQTITGRSGKRLAILAFATSCGETATHLYFLQTLGATKVVGAVASGLTTVVLTADPGPSSNGIAANDNIAIVLDNGTYQFTTVNSWSSTTKTAVLNAALGDDVNDGAAFYDLGIFSDTGHLKVALTASAQKADASDLGRFFGKGRGYPMIVYNPNPSATTASSIDYITLGYLDK